MPLNPTGTNTTPQNLILSNPVVYSATGGPGNMGFGNTGNPTPPMPPEGTNPYSGAPGSTTAGVPPSSSTFGVPPPVSMNPPGSPGAGTTGSVQGVSGQTLNAPNTFDQTGRQQNRTLQELQNQYGEGMGSMLYQYLQSGGGFNTGLTTQAISAQDAAMQQQIQMGFNTLGTNLAESGISPNSSVAALEKSNYMSEATTQENAIAAQEFYNMWNQSQGREASLLQDTSQTAATYTANQPTGLGIAQSWLGLGGTGAAAASQGISALDPNADTSKLDTAASMMLMFA